jgi:hypothetical protein
VGTLEKLFGVLVCPGGVGEEQCVRLKGLSAVVTLEPRRLLLVQLGVSFEVARSLEFSVAQLTLEISYGIKIRFFSQILLLVAVLGNFIE